MRRLTPEEKKTLREKIEQQRGEKLNKIKPLKKSVLHVDAEISNVAVTLEYRGSGRNRRTVEVVTVTFRCQDNVVRQFKFGDETQIESVRFARGDKGVLAYREKKSFFGSPTFMFVGFYRNMTMADFEKLSGKGGGKS